MNSSGFTLDGNFSSSDINVAEFFLFPREPVNTSLLAGKGLMIPNLVRRA